ncbi:hypothetical protein [Mangrovibacterium sp.]
MRNILTEFVKLFYPGFEADSKKETIAVAIVIILLFVLAFATTI